MVGATGAVGREMLAVLLRRGHGNHSIRAVASAASVGDTITVDGRSFEVEPLTDELFATGPLALLATDARTSQATARAVLDCGGVVVDNSSAFRADPDVPLVIPEVNGDLLRGTPPPRIVANPNCSTIILLLALEPLRSFGIREVVLSTYQAVSGAGRAAIHELEEQTRAELAGQSRPPQVFPTPIAFNVFPHESPVDERTGANEEERKIVSEARRIWANPEAAIEPTCVRVPVFRAHSQSVLVDLERPATTAQLLDALDAAAGIELTRPGSRPPTPRDATGRDVVLVGRVRPAQCSLGSVDLTSRGLERPSHRHHLWICGDQLLKGAALNAVQIAETCGWL